MNTVKVNIKSRQRPAARTMKFVVFVLVISLGGFTLPTTSWAVDSFNFKGPSASANFISSDGCINTFVSVFASDEVSHTPPGPPDSFSAVGIFIEKSDSCTNTVLVSAQGQNLAVADPDFQVKSQKLDSATLTTIINVFDSVNSISFDVSVDLTWTATGDITRSTDHTHFKSTGFHEMSKSTSTKRDAEATGSVLAGTENFTPNPSSTVFPPAFIQNVKSGLLVIE